jgi:hypothetical protein
MTRHITDDPILEPLRRLPRAKPAAQPTSRIRARSHAILVRNQQRQRASKNEFTSKVIDGGFVFISVAYLTGVLAQAVRLLGGLR